jgi:hypothetical protein
LKRGYGFAEIRPKQSRKLESVISNHCDPWRAVPD